jgi:heme a synthase
MVILDQTSLAGGHARVAENRTALRRWLQVVLFTLFCLVLVGGATRLTDSGLSITEWKPIHGVIPPLSVAEWEEELDLYRKIPQYQQINRGMSLDEFKTIFWWEWAHRLLARAIGLVFGLPLVYFWLTGRVERRLRWPLVGLLALGGFQGFIGWWMVSSGLTQRVDVSQYRLATHLTIACLIFAASTFIMRGLTPQKVDRPPTSRSHLAAAGLAFLVLFQIYLGALVAGLDAGFSYNTWPLMDGALVPGDLFTHTPAWINLFENPKTVQFVHRCGAYLLLTLTFVHMIVAVNKAPGSTHAKGAMLLFGLVCAQAAIGIVTLLTHVPIEAGLLHQAGGLLVLAYAIIHWRSFYGEFPRDQSALARA